MGANSPLYSPCKGCGSTSGLYSKEYAQYSQYYTWDGEADGYSDLDIVSHRKSTPLYCLRCGKKITTLEKMQEG